MNPPVAAIPLARRAPELLAPAGSLAMLETALAFGANAVYAGQPRYSLRVRNNDFGDIETLRSGIAACHARGAAFYLVSNIYAHDLKLRHYVQHMQPVIDLRPDALIMSDPGLIALAREAWPDLPIHLSVQANTVNAQAVRFWARNGITRVILSRELSLDEIARIRQDCPDTELEVFVHGALCIAYSGRCLLSGYFNHRDANQGTCTNACRWAYRSHDAIEDASGALQVAAGPAPGPASGCGCAPDAAPARVALWEQTDRPGELLPVEEDEHGTYVMNSRDLRAIEHVQRLVEIGIDSLKIEGRTKSAYYVARSVQSYRAAIDTACAGQTLDARWLDQLDGLASRGYTSGFYVHARADATQNYSRGHSASARSQYVGDVLALDAARGGWARVNVRNRFALGDRLECIQPQGVFEFTLSQMENADGAPISVAPGSGHTVWMPLAQAQRGAFLARRLDAPDDAVAQAGAAAYASAAGVAVAQG